MYAFLLLLPIQAWPATHHHPFPPSSAPPQIIIVGIFLSFISRREETPFIYHLLASFLSTCYYRYFLLLFSLLSATIATFCYYRYFLLLSLLSATIATF